MVDNFVGRMHEKADSIEACAWDVSEIQRALRVVGMDKLADRLFEASEILFRDAKGLRKICTDEVDAGLREAQEATGNMIRATLAMAEKQA